jgi:hypothetical protein
MRSRAPKDAARWHKSGVNRIAGSASPIFANQSHWWTENDPLSATVCMNGRLPPLVLAHPHHSSDPSDRPLEPAWQRDCSYPTEPCAHVRPPAAPERVLFRIPNGLTELVPNRILLLQTADVSIHLRAQGGFRRQLQALRILGYLPSAFWLSLFREMRAPGRQHSGHATEFTGTADDAAL